MLVGLDEDSAAFTARCDPEPVSALGEALALLGGRQSYELAAHTSGLRLTYRTARTIKARPAGSVPDRGGALFDVVVSHACRSPPKPGLPSVHKPLPREDHENEICPY